MRRITKMVQSMFLPPVRPEQRACRAPGMDPAKTWGGGRHGHLFHEGLLSSPRHARLLGQAAHAALRALRRLREERECAGSRARGCGAGEAADAVLVRAEATLRLGVERHASSRGLLWKSDKGATHARA